MRLDVANEGKLVRNGLTSAADGVIVLLPEKAEPRPHIFHHTRAANRTAQGIYQFGEHFESYLLSNFPISLHRAYEVSQGCGSSLEMRPLFEDLLRNYNPQNIRRCAKRYTVYT